MAMRMGFFELLLVLLFNLPYGLPPAEEDEKLELTAPEECYAHLVWNGTTEPDPNSDNATERILADAKMAAFADAAEQLFSQKVAGRFSNNTPPQVSQVMNQAAKWVFGRRDRATSVTIRQIQFQNGLFDVSVVSNIKDQEADVESLEKSLLALTKIEGSDLSVKQRTSGGVTYKSVQIGDTGLSVDWTTRDDYLILCFGTGVMEAQLKDWTKQRPPEWLVSAKKRLPIERRGHLLYLNAKGFLTDILALGPPQDFMDFIATFGIDDIESLISTYGLDQGTALSRIVLNHKGDMPDALKPFLKHQVELDGVPRDASVVFAGAVDLSDLLDLAIRGSDVFEDGWGQQLEDALGQAAPLLGAHPRECLFEALGPNVVLYGSPSEHGRPVMSGTLAIQVRKREALKSLLSTIEPILENAFRQKVNKQQAGGHQICSMMVLQPVAARVVWCLANDELLISTEPAPITNYLNRNDEFEAKSLPALKKSVTDKRVSHVARVDVAQFAPLLQGFVPMALAQIPNPTGQQPEFLKMLPSANDLLPHLRPSVYTFSHDADSVEIVVKESVPPLCVVPHVVGAVALTETEARFAAAPVGNRANAMAINRQKQIALALINYESTYGTFPPAYLKTKDGKPGLSWRVAILPFLEEAELYKEFHLDEPWDSDHNKKLLAKMPEVFRDPAAEADKPNSNFLSLRHKDSVMPGAEGIAMRDILDGTSNTILTVRVNNDRAVPWSKPDDFEIKEGKDALKGLGPNGSDTTTIGFSDGAVVSIPKTIESALFKELMTREGGEVIDRDLLR